MEICKKINELNYLNMGIVDMIYMLSHFSDSSLCPTCGCMNIVMWFWLDWHSIHINCGGREVSGARGLKYEADIAGGPSSFSRNGDNWGTSNTGHFMDDSNRKFLTTNISRLDMDRPELYMEARISPISLTYYGFCLYNGNYTVKLHFAEIMFTDDETYNSLGRRIFDVYIQVMQDCSIV